MSQVLWKLLTRSKKAIQDKVSEVPRGAEARKYDEERFAHVSAKYEEERRKLAAKIKENLDEMLEKAKKEAEERKISKKCTNLVDGAWKSMANAFSDVRKRVAAVDVGSLAALKQKIKLPIRRPSAIENVVKPAANVVNPVDEVHKALKLENEKLNAKCAELERNVKNLKLKYEKSLLGSEESAVGKPTALVRWKGKFNRLLGRSTTTEERNALLVLQNTELKNKVIKLTSIFAAGFFVQRYGRKHPIIVTALAVIFTKFSAPFLRFYRQIRRLK